MMFLNVPKELPDLIGLGLSAAVLQTQRARHLRMFVDVVTASGAIPSVAKGHNNLAEIHESDILRAVQNSLIKLARSHFFSRPCPLIVSQDTPGQEKVSIVRPAFVLQGMANKMANNRVLIQ